ncbi:phospholipase D-like domain-containing protein [Streptomyces sp. NPDC060048]|uniref:phospholipase D-like domain-containing protein n=1 Tax=unclassified Streptomyces TaxID=2593676 RepID=UPI0036ACD793
MTKIKNMMTAATALILGSVVCAAAPGAAAAVTQPAAGAVPLVTTGALFNDPSDPAKQDVIFGHLSRLIDGAVPGSSIKISSYVFGSDWLVGRLNAAHLRGVDVQVLLDSESLKHYAGGPSYTKLAEGLAVKTQTSGNSWVRVCGDRQACLAKDPNPADTAYSNNHNKFYLFSRTTGSASGTVPVDNVVVQTSMNQTPWDRQKAWNDALTVAGNTELFDAYSGYFGRLTAAQADPALQVSDLSTEYQAGKAKAYFFPRSASDPILNILNTVDNPVEGSAACYGNTDGFGTADGRTVIRIAMHQITRVEVAKKLWELDEAGCYVDIVYRQLDNTGTAIADQLAKPTKFGGISLHQLNDDAQGGTSTHSKYLLIEGAYKGLKNQKIVFTGSHPYTNMGLTSNDEALLKYEDADVHDAYRENFRTQRTAADQ